LIRRFARHPFGRTLCVFQTTLVARPLAGANAQACRLLVLFDPEQESPVSEPAGMTGGMGDACNRRHVDGEHGALRASFHKM